MASGGVIEFFQVPGSKHVHSITTLRDGGSTSENQRTTTAGRLT